MNDQPTTITLTHEPSAYFDEEDGFYYPHVTTRWNGEFRNGTRLLLPCFDSSTALEVAKLAAKEMSDSDALSLERALEKMKEYLKSPRVVPKLNLSPIDSLPSSDDFRQAINFELATSTAVPPWWFNFQR
jgi:hypothetical protein